MSIPKFTENLEIIQKLSDLPNSTEGMTSTELKARFDKAGLLIQKFINEQLVPALTAKKIPFEATNEIMAENIYDAILNVQSQIRDAATGTIVNGSVTKEKLHNDLLERIFGGRPWVSLDTPDSEDNVAAGFPVGQLWLRPRFTVTNAASDIWTATGCNAAVSGQTLTITGTNTVAAVNALQTLADVGMEGDRVLILFGTGSIDTEITGMTVSINGAEAVDARAGGVFETNLLASGAVTVRFELTWPSTSLANGSAEILNFSVVNVSKVLRQMSEVKDMTDWAGYLTALQPITNHISPAEVFIQSSDGQWWPFGFETMAVSRGGTGLTAVESGALLVGTGGEALQALAPGADQSFLHFLDGAPQWCSKEQTIANLNILQMTTGSYKGSKTTGTRTVTLPLTPKLLFLFSPDGTDSPIPLISGAKSTKTYSGIVSANGTRAYTCSVALSDNKLTFSNTMSSDHSYDSDNYTKYFNVDGKTYNWVALY